MDDNTRVVGCAVVALTVGLRFTSDLLLLLPFVAFSVFIMGNATSLLKGIRLALEEESGAAQAQGSSGYTAPSSSQSKPERPAAAGDLKPAMRLLKAGQPEKAIVQLSEEIARTPHWSAYLLRAKAYEKCSQWVEAAADAQQVLDQRPDHAQAWRIRVLALEHLGRLDDARKEADSAVELYEVSDADVLALRKRLAVDSGEARESRATILKTKANELYKNASFDAARDVYTRAIEELGNSENDLWCVLRNNRAACAQQLGDYVQVRADTDAVLGRREDLKARIRRAVALEALDCPAKALADARQVLLADPKHTVANAVANRAQRTLRSM